MSRLCPKVSPIFTEKNLQTLHQRKIYSVLDFLREDLELLAQLLKVSFKEVLQIRSNILMSYSAFPQQALNVYNDLVVNSALIPTGIARLDVLLEGGLLTGHLYELLGFSGVGKTQLCQSLAVNVSSELSQRVHVVDSCLSFSAARVHHMLTARGIHGQERRAVLERIQVTRVADVYEVLSLLHAFKEDPGITPRLVIIDSLPPLFFPFLGDNLSQGLGLMNHFASLLKLVSVECHVCVVLVNISTRIHEGEPLTSSSSRGEMVPPSATTTSRVASVGPRPALGRYWTHVPTHRLLLNKAVCGRDVTVTVAKSATIPAAGSRSCTLTLADQGVLSSPPQLQ